MPSQKKKKRLQAWCKPSKKIIGKFLSSLLFARRFCMTHVFKQAQLDFPLDIVGMMLRFR